MCGAGGRRALGRAGQADLRLARRQRDDALAADDRLELRQSRLVVGKDRLALELLGLERAEHGAVVAAGQAALARDQRRECSHLVLDLAEGDLRAARQLGGGEVDAGVAQRDGVELRGEPEIGPGARQDLVAQERVVGPDLGFERGECGVRDGDGGLVEEPGQPTGEDRQVRPVLLDLVDERTGELRIDGPLAKALHGPLEQRGRARGLARVALEPRGRQRAPLRRVPLVEQDAHALEEDVQHVAVGHEPRALGLDAVELAVDRLDHDVDVLEHEAIALGGRGGEEVGARRAERGRHPVLEPGLEVEDALVRAGHADHAPGLRVEAHEDVEDGKGQGVALRDPRRGRRGGGRRHGVGPRGLGNRRDGWCRRSESNRHGV